MIIPEINHLMELDPTHQQEGYFNDIGPVDLEEWFNCTRYEEVKGG